MTKLTYTHYDTFCNVCGVSEGSRRWEKWSWWHDSHDKFHICPDCQEIVRKALAIEEYKEKYETVFNLNFHISETAKENRRRRSVYEDSTWG